MRRFLRSMLYVGLFVGGIVILFESLGGTPATITSPSLTPTIPGPAAILNLLSSPWALLWFAVLGIFALLAVSVWRKTETAAGGFLWNQEKNDLTPLGKLLAVRGFVVWFIFAVNYAYNEPRLHQFFFGLSERGRWVASVILIALAHLPLSPLANFIVPTKGAFMRAVIYAVFVVMIAYGGSRAHTTHNFFDPKTGDSIEYIDPTTNKPYHHDGWAPDTGEKLIPVSKEIAKTLRSQSSIELAKQKADKWLKDALTKPAPPPPPPSAPPKEEKKMIAAPAAKRWVQVKISEADIKKPSSWSLPNLPAINFSMRRGQSFPWPGGGDGMCAGIFFTQGTGTWRTRGVSSVVNCNNQTMQVECVSDSCKGFAGYAFKGPSGLMTLVER